MENNYHPLLIIGLGFLMYFLIIIYGPYLFDYIFSDDNRHSKDKTSNYKPIL